VRLVALSAALGLAALAAPAVADGARPELAPGEVLLETSVQGSVSSPATRVTVTIPFSAKGATGAEARRAVDALGARLIAAARAAGVAAEDLRISHSVGGLGFIGNEAEAAAWSVSAPGAARPESHVATAALIAILRDPALFDRLQTALEGAGADTVPSPDFDLVDDMAARRAAKAVALGKAKGEAEAYAAALGMRVSRLLRVSERPVSDMTDPADILNYMKAMRTGRGGTDERSVKTTVRLAVDYALVAR